MLCKPQISQGLRLYCIVQEWCSSTNHSIFKQLILCQITVAVHCVRWLIALSSLFLWWFLYFNTCFTLLPTQAHIFVCWMKLFHFFQVILEGTAGIAQSVQWLANRLTIGFQFPTMTRSFLDNKVLCNMTLCWWACNSDGSQNHDGSWRWSFGTLGTTRPATQHHVSKTWIFTNTAVRTLNLANNVFFTTTLK